MALIKCPDCGREVSDLAPTCLGCGRPIAGATLPPSLPPVAATTPQVAPGRQLTGVLKSNLDNLAHIEPPARRRGFPVAIVLGGLVLLIAAVAVGLLLTAGQPTSPLQAAINVAGSSAARPQPTVVPGIAPTPRRSAPGVPAPMPDINGVSCDALEATIFHIHIHLAIFVDGQEQLVPMGIGIGQPWQVETSTEGPFVTDGSCFYWIHTHTEDGVVHVESPVRRRFTLGDFFSIWQVPLSATQVGPAQGPVITYVNGARDDRNPADIPLLSHERIQLDIGGDVPPYLFEFAPGD